MLYKYAVEYRPISFCTVPKGYVSTEKHPAWKHGVVVYDHPLDAKDIRSYELIPLVPLAEIVDRLAERFGKYANEYVKLAADDLRTFESLVGSSFEELNVYPLEGPFDRAEVAKLVLARLKRPAGGKRRHGGDVAKLAGEVDSLLQRR